MKSVIDPNKVTFSAGARFRFAAHGTTLEALRALTPAGLLGENATFNVEQTFRQKSDRFPEVVVAEAIQAQNALLQLVLQEWKRANLQAAFGLGDEDVTVVTEAGEVRAHRRYPIGKIGKSRYWTVMLEEELTNGAKTELVMYRARIGINGNLNFNNAAEGGNIPISVQALYDPTEEMLAELFEYDDDETVAAAAGGGE